MKLSLGRVSGTCYFLYKEYKGNLDGLLQTWIWHDASELWISELVELGNVTCFNTFHSNIYMQLFICEISLAELRIIIHAPCFVSNFERTQGCEVRTEYQIWDHYKFRNCRQMTDYLNSVLYTERLKKIWIFIHIY